MQIALEMPDVAECAYNVDKHCHARAITIGDGDNPGCDTFLTASHHTRNANRVAGVGACKVVNCRYTSVITSAWDSSRVASTASRITPDSAAMPKRHPTTGFSSTTMRGGAYFYEYRWSLSFLRQNPIHLL